MSREPIGAWARFLAERVSDMSERAAVSTAASLLGLNGSAMPSRLADCSQTGEGASERVEKCVARQIEASAVDAPRCAAITPVLRGKDWPADVIERLAARIESSGLAGIVYQGADFIGGPPAQRRLVLNGIGLLLEKSPPRFNRMEA